MATNRRLPAVLAALANRFGVGELLAEVTARPGGLPISVQGSAIRNFLTRGDLAGGAQRDGYEFGEGGTNRWGYISWLAYAPLDWMRVSAKYYYTERIDGAMPAAADRTRRFQLDLSLNF